MIEGKSHFKAEGGSERSFGFVFAAVFAIIGLWPLLGGESIRIWALVVAAAFLAAAFLRPQILAVPNRVRTKFGLLLGAIIAPIVMMAVFFLTVTPIALAMRAFGADPLRLKLKPEEKSYWIEREGEMGSIRNQY